MRNANPDFKKHKYHYLKILGKELQQEREARNITREELAFSVGINPVTLWRYEQGFSRPSRGVLIRLSHFLRTSNPLEDLKKLDRWFLYSGYSPPVPKRGQSLIELEEDLLE